MTQAELKAILDAYVTKSDKVHNEIKSRLEALEEAVRNNPVHGDVVTAVENLGMAIQKTDDLTIDAPPAPPA